MDDIAEIRAFNRFYTRQIGVLDASHLQTRFSLGEARIIYEIATRGTISAADLARSLSLDPAYVSRTVARLKDDGLLALVPSHSDKRQTDISVTAAGRAAFETLDTGSNAAVASLVTGIDPMRRAAMVAAMQSVRAIMGDAVAAAPLLLRPHRIGELGWLVYRQGLLYHQQFGWNGEFEALIAGLYRDFEQSPATPPKALWIAERQNAIVGSVHVTPSDGRDGFAQLRMLYVEPEARGLGIGGMLVEQAIAFARHSNYRRMRLWTQSILTSARKIYGAHGFAMVESKPHHSFGQDLVGEYWEREL
jgi:DNA-binding MarR family transcriptional regulator/N-acetylglutamate synthase-like GNAT family acetyltransferase